MNINKETGSDSKASNALSGNPKKKESSRYSKANNDRLERIEQEIQATRLSLMKADKNRARY